MKKILLLSWAFCLAALNLNAQNKQLNRRVEITIEK
jgi:hypothetical protein